MSSAVSSLATGYLRGGLIEPLLDALQEFGPMVTFEPGETVFIETFGKHFLGRVKAADYTTVTLEDASWVADSGRFGEFLARGLADGMEVEPVGEVTIQLMYISAKYPWRHALPKDAI